METKANLKHKRRGYKREYYLTHIIKLFYEIQMPFQVKMIDHWVGINTPKDLQNANSLGIN